MKRFLKSLTLGILLALPWIGASAQQVNTYCFIEGSSPIKWTPCSIANPMQVSGSFTPSGTQNVNLTQILGAAPSLTNPLWVFPATGATFPVSGTVTANQGTAGSAWPVTLTSTTITGTVAVTQSTSPWVVSNSGTFAVQAASTQSGTWTVQPGNTPNTTPWLVTSTPSAASGAGLTPITTAALAANQIVKASAGNLYSFEVSVDSTLSAAAWWIMLYNATSAPGDGAVTPLKCYALPSGATSYAAAFPTPVAFSTGITIGVSTTGCFTKTASTHAFISGDAQ